jgi:malonyl-CoA/methylmalonyl-CoA synthetase
VAIETADGPVPLHYTWRDLDRGTAMIANLLDSLELPRRAARRGAGREERRGADALPGRAARRPCLPAAEHRLPGGEIEYFIGNAEPAVVVCAGKNFGWVSKIAFKAGTPHVFTLGDDRSGTLLDRAAFHADQHEPVRAQRRPGRHPLHQRHHRAQQGRDAHARQPAVATRGC